MTQAAISAALGGETGNPLESTTGRQQEDALAAAIDTLHTLTAIYTADAAVGEVLDALEWPSSGKRLVEPSCGDGQFLVAAIARWLRSNPLGTLDRLTAELVAYEIHAGAAAIARQRVANALQAFGADAANRAAAVIVRTGDFLLDPSARASVVAGNPPYCRATRIPNLLRERYARCVPHHARADLLYAFLHRCAEHLSPGGRIALVTADRWLFNEGAQQLREKLGAKLALHSVRRLDARSAFYRPKDRRPGTPARVHPVIVVLGDPHSTATVLGRSPIFPNAPHETSDCPRLADIAHVRLAPWLGTRGVFVVDPSTARQFPPTAVVPAIDARDLSGGHIGSPRRFALRTCADSPPTGSVAAHLARELPRMAPRGRRSPAWWLPPETWTHLPIDRPALVVPRITRTLAPVRIPPGIVPINHSLHIVSASDAITLDQLQAALEHPDAQAWMRANAAPLENGFFSITTKTLRRLPITQAMRSAVAAAGPTPPLFQARR